MRIYPRPLRPIGPHEGAVRARAFPSASTCRTGSLANPLFIFSLPFCDWCLLRVYSLSPSAIGACYGYILSPLLHVATLQSRSRIVLRLASNSYRLRRSKDAVVREAGELMSTSVGS
eukprot:1187360-Prorocentrum_minimum.AAC.2